MSQQGNKKVCFTVITGDYDDPHDPLVITPGWDYVLITDNKKLSIKGYKTILIDKSEDQQKAQRLIKIYPYDILPGYELYLYHDGNYQVTKSLDSAAKGFKGGFGAKLHQERDCYIKEAQRVIELKKANERLVKKQVAEYIHQGIPAGSGCFESGIYLKDASESTKKLSAAWAAEVKEWSSRDQISLPAAIHKTGIKPVIIQKHIVESYFRMYKHKPKERPKIWYMQPYAVNKDIASIYNYHCSFVPENDWICITDQDSMFLLPETGKIIDDIINSTGSTYDLLGCYTNRIGSLHQCYNNERSENPDITYHHGIAKELHTKETEITEIHQGVAGFFMLMPQKTWAKYKFRNGIYFDTMLSKDILKDGGKIGLCEGVYRFHYYRFGEKDPKNAISHLL